LHVFLQNYCTAKSPQPSKMRRSQAGRSCLKHDMDLLSSQAFAMPTRRRPLAPVNPTRVGQSLLIGHCCRWSAIAVISRMIAPLLLGGTCWGTSRKVPQTFLSQPRNFSFFAPAVGSGSFLRHTPVAGATARGRGRIRPRKVGQLLDLCGDGE